MKNSTPMFPGFHLQTLRRKPRSEAQKLADKLALLQQEEKRRKRGTLPYFSEKSLPK
jgi:hypothetical protein